MHMLRTTWSAALVAALLLASAVQAAEDKSMGLFVNLAAFENGPAGHALHMAGKQMERGHPVTFFLNQKAVLFASKHTSLGKFNPSGKTVREMMTDAMTKGAKVIVCQMCAKMNGVDAADLIEGAMLGNPELVAEYLFDPSYQVVTW